MGIEEVKALILIGLGQPRLFKRSVWNKAKKVMDFLVQKREITECDNGPGKEKYMTKKVVADHLERWAEMYKNQEDGN